MTMRDSAALIAALTLFCSSLLHAHEGHDHSSEQPAPPAAVTTTIDRSETQSELYELVLVQEPGRWRLYLDQYASNAPVPDAHIEIESGNWKASARAVADGSYEIEPPFADRPGRYPLTFSINAAAGADLLESTVQVSSAAAAVPATTPTPAGEPSSAQTDWKQRVWLLVLGGLLLSLLPFGLWRARR